MSPDEVRANTEVIDITLNFGWLAAARWEVAVGYSKLANPKRKLHMRDLYTTLCKDHFETDGRSRTFAAIFTNPRTQAQEIAAVVRLVIGRASGSQEPPIDAMNFMQPQPDWPHRQQHLSDDRIGEIGRFTITDDFRTQIMKESQIDIFVGSLVFGAALSLAQARGLQLVYTIMPTHASDLTHRAGYYLIEIPATLKSDDPAAAQVFDQFSIYWRRMTPRLYEAAGGHGPELLAQQNRVNGGILPRSHT